MPQTLTVSTHVKAPIEKVFEVYTGEGLAEDRKSVNFTVTLGSMDKTLSAKDEEKFLKRVRQRCGEVGAELRG